MRFVDSTAARYIARFLIFAMLNLSLPSWMFSKPPAPSKPEVSEPKPQRTRPLTFVEMNDMSGAHTTRNPYISGAQKWGINYNGVDLLSGNFSFSATDLSFEGGYGIPIAVTRTYSANNPSEGPFGFGWSLSADIRTTAGGVLKSASAPVRSVPVTYRERPIAAGLDPRDPTHWFDGSTSQPITEGVIAVDSSGYEETIARDVDGVLTTPPWDKNLTETNYEKKELPGGVWQLPTQIMTTTPEGTIYVYEAKGFYDNDSDGQFESDIDGIYPYNDYQAEPTPTYILKITSITDRHGNQVLFTYGAGLVSFNTGRGTAKEHPLTKVEMSNGREINFVWDGNRVVEVNDGDRVVEYGYQDGFLTSVTSPGGKTTTYAYDAPVNGQATTSDLLVSITDHRGLETQISYVTTDASVIWPYGIFLPSVVCFRIIHPNGVHTYYGAKGVAVPDNLSPYLDTPVHDHLWSDWTKAHSAQGTEKINEGAITVFVGSSEPVFSVVVHNFDARHNVTSGGPPAHQNGPYGTVRTFNIFTQDLLNQLSFLYPGSSADNWEARHMPVQNDYGYQTVNVDTSYNFRGNPLSRTVEEKYYDTNNNVVSGKSRTHTTQYAYWGAKKYYQQKAVKDNAGRFTFTDYFNDEAEQGKKGQVHKVFNQPFATFTGTGGSGWRSTIEPNDENKYTARFDYDSVGRPTDVWKLQDSSSTYIYVRTHTTYHSLYGGSAHEVYEDYGGQDERITSTDEYDSAGRPTIVTDAAGKVFATTYNADGQVLTVYRTDVNPDKKIVEYVYGTENINNGMPISVTDGIYQHRQVFTYESDGGGRGQIQKVESGHVFNPFNCTVTYVYNDAGERWRVKYETPNTGSNGQWWQYSDYISVGNPDSPKRVFQTLNRMSNSTTLSEEEFHYIFDSSGRLMHAAFAQTPTLSSPNNGKWYIESSPASSRAVVSYDYAPGGQVLTVLHRWGTWNQPNPPADGYYAYSNIQRSVYSYEAARGLRLTADFQLWSESSWSTDHKQEYGYDSNLDYLTSATYSTSYTGSESWSYDAAGNRSGSGYSYDALNRMLASPKPGGGTYTYQNDVLGNRTWRNYGQSGVQRYIWDEVNRLKSLCGTSEGARYEYRADGMRVKKITGLTIEWVGDEYSASGYYDENLNQDLPTVRYFYDGQMPMEEDSTYKENSVSVRDYTQYGLGARGIDYIRNVHHSSGEAVAFPIYDGHGNMVYTLSRGANETFSLGNKRVYGAWGDLRYDGNPGDGPNTQYCANLGHKKDGETDLIYMRARYYEPWTGRFVSEDKTRDGWNWYAYCDNDPIQRVDYSGNSYLRQAVQLISAFILLWFAAVKSGPEATMVAWAFTACILFESMLTVLTFLGVSASDAEMLLNYGILSALNVGGFAIGVLVATSPANKTLSFWTTYVAFLAFTIILLDMEVELITNAYDNY